MRCLWVLFLSVLLTGPTSAAPGALSLEQFWREPVTVGASPGHPLTAHSCGNCHAPQYRAWVHSLHARALDAGVRAQLIASQAYPAWVAGCLSCHGPAAQAADRKARRAVDCASCHVRQRRRFGPPLKRYLQAGARVHHGFRAEPWFLGSQYCAVCHQFHRGGTRLQGVLLENTYHEWRASAYARRGVTCQACHMSGGQHHFEGIHDAPMVRRALHWSWTSVRGHRRVRLRLTATNVGAGHDVPTYTTARIDIRISQTCGGAPCPGSRMAWELGRKISLNLQHQYYDTRLAPGHTAVFDYDRPCQAGARSLEMRVRVRPDAAYVRFFREYLTYNVLPAETRRLAARALWRDQHSAYILWSQKLRLRCHH